MTGRSNESAKQCSAYADDFQFGRHVSLLRVACPSRLIGAGAVMASLVSAVPQLAFRKRRVSFPVRKGLFLEQVVLLFARYSHFHLHPAALSRTRVVRFDSGFCADVWLPRRRRDCSRVSLCDLAIDFARTSDRNIEQVF